ncbi:MAG: hypothetical protein FJX25_03965 [Alphaproteobacteria bacterium]|nr:hypothetical protein [Alphaproteobacteria bacterium]
MGLRRRLRAHLAQDWREDLTPAWQEFFDDDKARPDLPGMTNDDHVADPADLFPARLQLGRPRRADEVVPARHMTRAFDCLTPATVKIVVLGQDPYPRIASATGRAFEDGAWSGTRRETEANSLKRLLQSAAACQHPDLQISEDTDDWATIWDAIDSGNLAAPVMPRYFDDLAEQGVLCVNAAWTFTGRAKVHLNGHLKVWRPVMQHLILELLRQPDGGPVFLLLGRKAKKLFRSATWRHLRAHPEHNVRTVYCAHPTAWRGQIYFDYPNPLTRVNGMLDDPERIRWWPELPR